MAQGYFLERRRIINLLTGENTGMLHHYFTAGVSGHFYTPTRHFKITISNFHVAIGAQLQRDIFKYFSSITIQ